MRFLLIEDEQNYISRVQEACKKADDVSVFTPLEFGLSSIEFDELSPLEEQLLTRLDGLRKETPVDIVLLDSDLSRQEAKLRTRTEYQQGFHGLGIPVCRYRKGQTQTRLAKLEFIRRLAMDGASAIWAPPDRVDGELSKTLVPWLKSVHAGFEMLVSKLQANASLLRSEVGPAGILADLLGRPALKADLLGYTSQNFFFFSLPSQSDDRATERYAVQLGYWLHNYILAFPGPILNAEASAAFLNLQADSFKHNDVQSVVSSCRYAGPFGELDDYYWKTDLGDLLNELDGDIANAPTLKGHELTRVDSRPYVGAYYCVLTQEVIRDDEAAVNPDWIPVGASITRIKESEFDELGPMLRG